MLFSKKTPPTESTATTVPPLPTSPLVPEQRPSLAPVRLKRGTRRLQRELNATTRRLWRFRMASSHRYEPKVMSEAPTLKSEPVVAPAPTLNVAATQALIATAPALVELQYEVIDLRHQLQALQNEIAMLKAASAVGPVPVIASHVLVQDAQGQVVASLTPDGVLACSSISFLSKQ